MAHSQMQAVLLYCAYGLYTVHLVSVPLWLLACLREFWRQRHMKTSADMKSPTGWEYFACRCFLVYALADSVRNADAVFECDNGSFYSIWGVGTFGFRVIAWWIRDTSIFVGVAIYLSFTLCWTHTALGLPSPIIILRGLVACCVTVVLGLACGFAMVVVTNRVAWVVFVAVTIVPLNFGMAVANTRLLWVILPELEQLSGKVKDGQASALISQVRRASALMLVFNISYLAVIPYKALDKILQGAYSTPVAPVPLGTWIGRTALPRLADLPADVLPLPVFEVMELMLGWMNVAACVLASRGYNMSDGQRVDGPYVDHNALGQDMKGRLGPPSARTKAE